jgi:hypothetical protein
VLFQSSRHLFLPASPPYLEYNPTQADKPGLPAGTTKESAKVTATDFANEIFNKADQEDRAGFADKVR